jgi:hypothetical protein
MSGPYTPQQYEKAKASLSDPSLNEASRRIRAQRIAEFEGKKPGMGNLRAMEGSGGPLEVKPEPAPAMPTLGEVDSQFGPSYLANAGAKDPTAGAIRETGAVLTPEKMEARRQQTEWAKKLTTEPSLKNASKLKVFDDPPEYSPPKDLPGQGLLPKATTMYYEPTPGEFRTVMMSNPRVKAALQEQYPSVNIEELDEGALEDSGAFKAYADARWQHALAGALKTHTPITRVAFSDKTSTVDPKTGQRKLNLSGHLANAMDGSMSLMTGALQGATGGLYDLGMTAVDKALPGSDPGILAETRDAGRGSRERYPITATVGTVAGALDPRQLPGKIAGGIGKLTAKVATPKSLPGRMATSAGIGAATTVIDENMRAAADLAADALDADKSAREAALMIAQGLPMVDPTTAAVGAGLGAVADLAGAGFGTGKRAMVNSDRLRAPLKHFEESGGTLGPMMGRRVSPEAQKYQARAESARTTPQDLIIDEVTDSLATQRLLEQESALRSGEQATSVAQAKLDGSTVSPSMAAERIRADAESMPAATPQAKAARKNLLDFANRLASKERLTAAELDDFLQEIDDAAKFGRSVEPVGHWKQAGKHLRDLRDEFRFNEDATVVTEFQETPEIDLDALAKGIDQTSLRDPKNAQAEAYRPDHPPVEIHLYPGETPKLTDGRHRVLAAQRAGAPGVRASIRTYDDEARLLGIEEKFIPFGPHDRGVFNPGADVTIADVPAKQVGGVRDKRGNVKAVEDYSAEKLRQSKLQGFHKDMNKRLGLPEDLQGEPVLSEPYVSKGIFDPKTPQEIAESLPVKARLDEDQRTAFGSAIRKSSGRDYLKNRRELESLAERTDDSAIAGRKGGLPIKKKLEIIRLLDDKDQLSQALGQAVDQLSSHGNVSVNLLKKVGFRAIPTLKSLSGGLPAKPTTPGVSDQAVARLREFIPEWEALHLRGGKPARVLGSARDREEPKESKFSPEEKDFWLKVIEKISEENKPKKAASQ